MRREPSLRKCRRRSSTCRQRCSRALRAICQPTSPSSCDRPCSRALTYKQVAWKTTRPRVTAAARAATDEASRHAHCTLRHTRALQSSELLAIRLRPVFNVIAAADSGPGNVQTAVDGAASSCQTARVPKRQPSSRPTCGRGKRPKGEAGVSAPAGRIGPDVDGQPAPGRDGSKSVGPTTPPRSGGANCDAAKGANRADPGCMGKRADPDCTGKHERQARLLRLQGTPDLLAAGRTGL